MQLKYSVLQYGVWYNKWYNKASELLVWPSRFQTELTLTTTTTTVNKAIHHYNKCDAVQGSYRSAKTGKSGNLSGQGKIFFLEKSGKMIN